MDDPSDADPVGVQVLGSHGYVWDAADVVTLRRRHRLVGVMVGGLAGFAAQVEVSGLPLQLSLEEVALALTQGWITLYTRQAPGLPAPANAQSASTPSTPSPAAGSDRTAQHQQQPAGKRQRPTEEADEGDDACYDDCYAAYYGDAEEALPAGSQSLREGVTTQADSLQRQRPGVQPQPQQEERGQPGGMDDAPGGEYDDYYAAYAEAQGTAGTVVATTQQAAAAKQGQSGQPPWHDAVRHGAHFAVPLTAQEAGEASAAPVAPCTPAEAALPPLSEDQARRLAVFCDLYSRGFHLTSGVKFGGHFMLYPGDPKLYHAQFVVRVVQWNEALCPTLLKSWSRGVHGARKHLVLASVEPRALADALQGTRGWRLGPLGEGAFLYATFARETGFVSSKAAAPPPPPPPPPPRGEVQDDNTGGDIDAV